MKLHLVDGTYELFRTFYGAPPAHDAAGRPVGALRALVSTLISLVSEPDVTHVACAFDHVIESFRNELYAGYKTGDGIEPDLLAQFHPAEDATEALGIVAWRMIEFEADDALATAASRFRDDPGVEQVVICTPDKDLSQCVTGSRVICRDRRRAIDRDEAALYKKLATLRTDVPLAEDLAALEWRGAPRARLEALLARIGALELLDRVPRWC